MKRLLLIIAGLFFSLMIFAQQKMVTGVVLNKDNHSPLAGVTVTTKSKTVSTDANGKFSIEASAGENLTFSFVGMKPVTIKVKSADNLNVELEEGVSELDQVVVTGYQTQRKVDLTGAVSVVKTRSEERRVGKECRDEECERRWI